MQKHGGYLIYGIKKLHLKKIFMDHGDYKMEVEL